MTPFPLLLWTAMGALPEGTLCAPVTAIPEVPYEPAPGGRAWTPLRRAHDLTALFLEGDGTLVRRRQEPIRDPFETKSAPHVLLRPMSWIDDEEREKAARLAFWFGDDFSASESMLSFVLEEGDSWCTSELVIAPGALLRLHAIRAQDERDSRLVISEAGKQIAVLDLARPKSLGRDTAYEWSLRGGNEALCFEAKSGSVAVGEGRVLVPEAGSRDARPRWIVLTIIDTFRADLLEHREWRSSIPEVSKLAAEGHHYRTVVSPGCHTRAALFPLITGRDLSRLGSLQRRYEVRDKVFGVYEPGNVPVTHLVQAAGYHTVFLGNNAWLNTLPAFARFSSHGALDTGTIDAMKRLPELFRRYRDERVFVVHYVSTTHGRSHAPERIANDLGCARLSGVDQCWCLYLARARHADEAISHFQRLLKESGLEERSIHFLTSDHGEVFGDDLPLEVDTESSGTLFLNGSHGYTCRPVESRVPLVVSGRGVRARVSEEPRSGLDIFPSILREAGVLPVGRLDGIPLEYRAAEPSPGGVDSTESPRSIVDAGRHVPQGARAPGRIDARRPRGGASEIARPLVSYGFCTFAVTEGAKQLLFWEPFCSPRRLSGTRTILTHRSELFVADRIVARSDDHDPELERFEDLRRVWIADRARPILTFLDLDGFGQGRVEISSPTARIVDYGPASGVARLGGIAKVEIDRDERHLAIEVDRFSGTFFVATRPAGAPLKIHARTIAGDKAVMLAGALQLPLEIDGEIIDPKAEGDVFDARRRPRQRPGKKPRIGIWWQAMDASGAEDRGSSAAEVSEFSRVLRQWGYIR